MVDYFLPLLKIFSFSFPNRVVFGIGSSDTVGKEAKNIGSRSGIFITDKNLIKTDLADNLISNLEKENIRVNVFDRIVRLPCIFTKAFF